jgi:hypothetical protein
LQIDKERESGLLKERRELGGARMLRVERPHFCLVVRAKDSWGNFISHFSGATFSLTADFLYHVATQSMNNLGGAHYQI